MSRKRPRSTVADDTVRQIEKKARLPTNAFQDALEDVSYPDKLFRALRPCLADFSDPLVRIVVEFAKGGNSWQMTSDSSTDSVQITSNRCVVSNNYPTVRLFTTEKLYSGIHRLTMWCAPYFLGSHWPGIGIVIGDTLHHAADSITWQSAVNQVWAASQIVEVCGKKSPDNN